VRGYLLVRPGWEQTALSGEIAARFGGAWSPPGLPAIYAHDAPAGAALSLLVHLNAAPTALRGYRFLVLELPDPLTATHAGRDRPREVGAHFLRAGQHLGLRVPSRWAPGSWLVLINPRHPAFQKVAVREGPVLLQ